LNYSLLLKNHNNFIEFLLMSQTYLYDMLNGKEVFLSIKK